MALSVLRPRQAEALLDEDAFENEEFLPYWAELGGAGTCSRETSPVRSWAGGSSSSVAASRSVARRGACGAEVLATDWSPTAIALARGERAPQRTAAGDRDRLMGEPTRCRARAVGISSSPQTSSTSGGTSTSCSSSCRSSARTSSSRTPADLMPRSSGQGRPGPGGSRRRVRCPTPLARQTRRN